VTPDVHIYARSKVGWLALPESAAVFDEFYDVESLWPMKSLERVRALAPAR
jgi:hypothetical protein